MTYVGVGILFAAAIVAVYASIHSDLIMVLAAAALATVGIVTGLFGLSRPRKRARARKYRTF